MIKVVIIEDNLIHLDIISTIIEDNYKCLNIIGKAMTLIDGIKIVYKLKPDIIFLDIMLPDGIGFDLLNCFPDNNFKVVIISANKTFAYKAIKYSVFDFVSKPINELELEKTILKIQTCFMDKFKNIEISVNTEKKRINQKEIIFIKGDSPYSEICCNEIKNNITTIKTLSQFEILLCPCSFFRVHKSWIINKEYITNYNSNTITLNKQYIVPIARSRKKNFKNFMTEE